MNDSIVYQYGFMVVGLVTGRALRAFWSNWMGWDTFLVLTQGGRGGGYLGWPRAAAGDIVQVGPSVQMWPVQWRGNGRCVTDFF